MTEGGKLGPEDAMTMRRAEALRTLFYLVSLATGNLLSVSSTWSSKSLQIFVKGCQLSWLTFETKHLNVFGARNGNIPENGYQGNVCVIKFWLFRWGRV